MILDILDQGVNKWTSNIFYSTLDPIIVMEEVSLAS